MVKAANMNPLFLDFPNFLIAQDDEKQVVGIGQIRPLGIFLCVHHRITCICTKSGERERERGGEGDMRVFRLETG
jgi:hypothetical protein